MLTALDLSLVVLASEFTYTHAVGKLRAAHRCRCVNSYIFLPVCTDQLCLYTQLIRSVRTAVTHHQCSVKIARHTSAGSVLHKHVKRKDHKVRPLCTPATEGNCIHLCYASIVFH